MVELNGVGLALIITIMVVFMTLVWTISDGLAVRAERKRQTEQQRAEQAAAAQKRRAMESHWIYPDKRDRE